MLVVGTAFDEMSHHVPLQMIDVNQGDTQRTCKTLGEVDSHEQRSHQARTSCESHCRDLALIYASLSDGLVNHRHDILLMSTRSQFRHHTAISLMYCLGCRDVRQQQIVMKHSCRCIVATRLNSQNENVFLHCHAIYINKSAPQPHVPSSGVCAPTEH